MQEGRPETGPCFVLVRKRYGTIKEGGSAMEIQLWREILDPYRLAVDELIVKFNHIKEEYRNAGLYSPIENVEGRVKKISSILDKLQRKGIGIEQMEDKLEDIAGLRLICQFEEDIYRVVEIIRNRSDMRVRKEKDYITNSKPSGYRSYHVIVEYVVQTMQGPKEIPVEIQIRTLAMDFWATVEHSLQYKYKENMPDHIRKRLHSASEAVVQLDKEMASVRGEIIDAQNTTNQKANIISDILNNIENLYRVANKREVLKIQDEFYHVFQEDDLEKLVRFNKQLDIIAESYSAQSVY